MTTHLTEKKILLGISGGIASYKVADWVRSLKKLGADVSVVMTDAATKFVSPMTFAALSGKVVHTDIFALEDAEQIPHIQLAKDADLILVAPATANTIAKLANGFADDLLSTIILAAKSKVLICPAMNSGMYCHAATQENLNRLKKYGYQLIEPDTGTMACGDEGPGRLPEWETVRHHVLASVTEQDLQDMDILITAGPTREMLDPVRYLSNRSTGKMGYALAATAARRGANVTLISGPSSLADPVGVKFIHVTSAEQMYQTVMEHSSHANVVVKAAAVSDYRPKSIMSHKIKKAGTELEMKLELCPDILKELGRRKAEQDQFPLLVGFAAESQDHVEEGKRKLKDKNLDCIVVNDILCDTSGFESDTNRVIIIDREENISEIPLLSKEESADHIWNNILRLLSDSSS